MFFAFILGPSYISVFIISANVIQLFAVAVKFTKTFDYSRTITITKATFRNARKPLLQKTVVVGCILISYNFEINFFNVINFSYCNI